MLVSVLRGALDAPGLVFVKSERPILEKFLDDVLPGFQHPFVLYTGNADLTIPYQLDRRGSIAVHGRFESV